MAIHEREKLCDLGLFFKRSFKCFKNEKNNFIQAIRKLETLLYQNIFISFHLISYILSDLDSNKKKGTSSLKNMTVIKINEPIIEFLALLLISRTECLI